MIYIRSISSQTVYSTNEVSTTKWYTEGGNLTNLKMHQ